tara:strand:+ start:364 stop:669 length:306 start_codon:yes stop_codon:yes gene_type:complete
MNVMAKKKNTIMAFIAVFLGLLGFIIAILTSRDDKYVMHYAKQSLALIIANAVAALAMFVLIGFLALPVVFVLWVIAWINALSGKEKKLPLLQWLADKFDF